ncbi:MAG TPA: carboxypeptidase regulatory-like domain-containing protein, partial [Candidatus Aquilonibacter sp.]
MALAFALSAALPATAATTSVVTGAIRGSNGAAIAGADVELIGPTRLSQQSDAAGNFNFPNVPTGLYALQVSKAGFQTVRQDNVAAFIGETVTLNIVLPQSSFSSLRTIASVSTRNAGVAQINTSTAAINTINSQVFADQGAQQVTSVLNQTPGIFMTTWNPGNGNPSNGASPSSAQTPQIRGALPYETESLIDGHPVSVGSAGTFSPTLINPFLLQDVELVKGPGSMPPEINYAINGTVNYRTLDPTPELHVNTMYSVDKWGGISLGIKASGQTQNHKIGYAVGYVTFGAPGPLENYPVQGSQIVLANGPPGGPYYVNGHQLAMLGTPLGEGLAPAQFAPYAGMQLVFSQPLTGCCYDLNAGYHANSQLAKLQYNFSNNTSFKVSYLGGQSVAGNGDAETYNTDGVGSSSLPAFAFQPCGSASQALTCNPFATGTSYSCTTPSGPGCGSSIPFDLSTFNGQGYTWQQQNLFQGEFRTTLGSTGTVLARYYTGALNTYAVEGASGEVNESLSAYGTVPLCPLGDTFNPAPPSATNATGYMCLGAGGAPVAPTNTTFDGQRVTFQTVSLPNTFFTNDTMSGETVEMQEQLGQDTWTLAYDRSQQQSAETADEPSVGIIVFS